MSDRGLFMQTYSGRAVWPIDPRPEDVDIKDIAHSLALQCRYNGHVTEFYSVAEHCTLISWMLPDKYKLWGLLHDASEAYVTDIPRPLKPYLKEYLTYEDAWMSAITTKFGLPAEMPEIVREYDSRILQNERKRLMVPMIDGQYKWSTETLEPLPMLAVPCWSWQEAERMFLEQFDRCIGGT